MSLGADVVLDYHDSDLSPRLKSACPTPIRHAFAAVRLDKASLDLLEATVSPGGSIVSALSLHRPLPNHITNFAVAGVIHELDDWGLPDSHLGKLTVTVNSEGARKIRQVIEWALAEAGKDYCPSKIRKLSGKGLYDALEAFDLMKKGKISGEKVVYWMADTPELEDKPSNIQ